MEKMNVSNADELRRPASNAYCEDASEEDTDTLSELSENELLFGFLNPNSLPNTSALVGGQHPGHPPTTSVGD